MRAVFLDRDGVINLNRDDHVTSQAEFQFLPGALQAMAALARSSLQVVVVTNQSAVGLGRMTAGELLEIHSWMLERVRSTGGRIDAIYACPHLPEEDCLCRKPRPGLLHQAARELDLDLGRSFMIGDAASDVQVGLAAGCQPILVLTGRGQQARLDLGRKQVQGYCVARDLSEASRLIRRLEAEVAVGQSPQRLAI